MAVLSPPIYGDTAGSLTGKQQGLAQNLVGPGDHDNTIYGDAGVAITDHARGGNDTLVGGGTSGTSVTNTLFGDTYTLSGNAFGGNDALTAGINCSGLLYGDAYEIFGNAHGGNDTVTGGSNSGIRWINVSNELYGDAYTMSGKAIGGDDTLVGGDVNSGGLSMYNVLYGDAHSMSDAARGGNDVLIAGTTAPGGQVWNTMYGDAVSMSGLAKGGADTFVFHDNGAMTVGHNNVIGDFSQTQHDKIEFIAVPGAHAFADLFFDTTTAPGSTIIRGGIDNVTFAVELLGFTGTLTAHDFLFV